MWRAWSESLSRAITNAGATYGAVGERDGTSELNEIAGRDGVVLLHERNEVVHGVVDTVVGGEVRLDIREDEHRTVGTSTAKYYKYFHVFISQQKTYALRPKD